MRIAVVNDQEIAIEALRRALLSSPYRLAWIARDGQEAVTRCAADVPDLILMDLFMPVMDGVEATRRIMAHSPCAILVVTANIRDSASKVFEAMGAGALDAVNTPSVERGEAPASLLRKIETIGSLIGRHPVGNERPAASEADTQEAAPLFAIGASTGGPAALAVILGALPVDFPAALVIVQHVDAQFAGGLAEWLCRSCLLPVSLAAAGDRPEAGRVLVAATNDHMVMTSRHRLAYTAEPLNYPYRPSVNVFFESLARHWPTPSTAVLLTGMGRDGAQGLLTLRKAGWRTIAQERASCAVYGMPKAAAELGAADMMLPPLAIAQELCARIGTATSKTNRGEYNGQ